MLDVLREARPAPDDAVGRVVAGAVRAVVEAGQLGDVVRQAPRQALARLHTAAVAGLVDDDELGRPRAAGEAPRDLPGPGAAPQGRELAERLDGVVRLLQSPGDVPALVVASLVHGELMAVRPFVVGSGVVARAVFRSVVVGRGLDPTGVAAPEVACAATGLPAYVAALQGYVTGTPEGVGGWLRYCAGVVERGAAEGVAVADAVLAGRLSR
ncbi:hypothetical protein GCM10027446_18580 [Angustibacter peucedani]